ncbi:MAG: tetratricopeptide repeat protein [Spirochaetota bacterium]|nr:tetratricopeptide repeat protein [Spirochaetota bacterium]
MSVIIENRIIYIIVIIILSFTKGIFAESVSEINSRAQEYYDNKDFGKAISEWLRILEIDPDNEEIQKKIELVYEEKHRKDVAAHKARLHLKLAKRTMKSDFEYSKINAEDAIRNFIIAYRIDPNDPELRVMKGVMRELDESIKIEERKNRLSDEMRKEYYTLFELAEKEMDLERYSEGIKYWDRILFLVPIDKVAKEGKRKAELAIANRLKYERIKALLESGISLFRVKKYTEAKLEFEQALSIDPSNIDAKDYINRIEDILSERRSDELKRMHAESLYKSGIENLKNKRFSDAEEDFMNILALFDNYKDVASRLSNIKRLREEFEEQNRVMRLKKIDKEFRNGLLALADGRYKEAIMFFDSTLLMDPNNRLAKRYIESAKEANRQLEEEKVDDNSPYYDVINSLVVSGKLLYEQGNYVESMRRWEKILKLFPKNRIATEYLLKCNLQSNPESFREFSKIIISEGNRLLKDRKYRLALGKYEMIKSISSNYPGIDQLIARAKGGLKRKTLSNRTDTVSFGTEKVDINKIYKLGLSYYRKGGKNNIEKALVQFKRVVSKDPDNMKALININKIEAQLRISKGGRAESVEKKRLTEKQRQLVRIHYFKGINYYSNNNFNRAIEEWRKVLAIDPTYEKARINIRKCFALIKR